jgi:hypothetical protein
VGTVVADATLDANGSATDEHVLSGSAELRDRALRFLLGRRFAGLHSGDVKRARLTLSENSAVAMRVDQNPQAAAPKLPPQRPKTQNPFEASPQAPEEPKPEPPNTQVQTVARERPPADIIEAIDFRGSRRVPQDKLLAMISTKPGDPYNEDAMHRDSILLGDTGLFDDIRMELEAGQKGWIIHYVLVQRRIVGAIKTGVYCHGNFSVDQVIECK